MSVERLDDEFYMRPLENTSYEGTHFAHDARRYARLGEMMLAKEVVLDTPPENSEFTGMIMRNPLSGRHAFVHELAEAGMKISLTRITDQPTSYVFDDRTNLLVHAHDDDSWMLEEALGGKWRSGVVNLRFLSQISSLGISLTDLREDELPLPKGLVSLRVFLQDGRHGLPDAEIKDTYIERGFMNSVLLGADRIMSPRSLREQRVNDELVEAYEELREQGRRPFDGEALYGMASMAVRDFLETNPDIASELAQRKTAK